MIDVVFLLIIFFMVGTRFSEIEHQYDVELPHAAAVQPMTARPDAIVVNVSRAGEVLLNGEKLSLTELSEQLKNAREAYAEQAVLIRGDGSGTYQPIIDVMDICHQVKIQKFSLAFQPSTSED